MSLLRVNRAKYEKSIVEFERKMWRQKAQLKSVKEWSCKEQHVKVVKEWRPKRSDGKVKEK